jgi:hypothetical protein
MDSTHGGGAKVPAMPVRMLVAVLSLLVSAGCKKEEAAPQQAASTVEGGVEAAPPPPFTGTLTAAQLQAAVKQVQPRQPWDVAWAGLRAAVGEPTKVDGDVYGWYVLEGGKCHFLEVTRDRATSEVGSSQQGAADEETAGYFAKCKAGAPAGASAATAGERRPPGGHGSGTGGGEGRGDGSGGGVGDGSGRGDAGAGEAGKAGAAREKPGLKKRAKKPAADDEAPQGGW